MSLFVRSEHEQKYDRQTRIWGAHGQEAIETAHICVLGAGPTASETLKNLVLPNVGEFTLVDEKVVAHRDLGNNFFVDQDGLGKPRAQVVADLLLEMNDSVKGHAVQRSPKDVIEKDLAFFDKFTAVIAAQLDQPATLKLAAYLWDKNIPLITLNVNGLIGVARLAVPELEIVETHYENDRADLRVHPKQLALFPELRAYCDQFDLKTMDTLERSHVPYVALLVIAMDKWLAEHNGQVPCTYDDKMKFKESISKTIAGEFVEQENFSEAVKFAYRAYSLPEIAPEVEAVFADPKCANLRKDSSNFWLLAAAVKAFMDDPSQGAGFLPVLADVPDMASKTEHFLKLQSIFAAKAREHRDLIREHVERLCKQVGKPGHSVSDRELDYFVKNVRGIKAVHGRSLADEYDAKTFDADEANELLEEWEEPSEDLRPKDVHWYFAMRAAAEFKIQHGRAPGDCDKDKVDSDAAELIKIQQRLFDDNRIRTKVIPECLAELTRYGESEIHNVAAVVGGIGAQVALKIILRQFVPLDCTLVHNAILGRQKMMRF